MANSKQSAKRARVSEKKRTRNRVLRVAARSRIRQANEAIVAGDETLTAEALNAAISLLDRAANKGIIHANNAARRKSRLMARYNATQAAEA